MSDEIERAEKEIESAQSTIKKARNKINETKKKTLSEAAGALGKYLISKARLDDATAIAFIRDALDNSGVRDRDKITRWLDMNRFPWWDKTDAPVNQGPALSEEIYAKVIADFRDGKLNAPTYEVLQNRYSISQAVAKSVRERLVEDGHFNADGPKGALRPANPR